MADALASEVVSCLVLNVVANVVANIVETVVFIMADAVVDVMAKMDCVDGVALVTVDAAGVELVVTGMEGQQVHTQVFRQLLKNLGAKHVFALAMQKLSLYKFLQSEKAKR